MHLEKKNKFSSQVKNARISRVTFLTNLDQEHLGTKMLK